MLKKTYAFGILAASLIIAPSTAFANQQDGGSAQVLNQSTVIGGSGNSSRQSGSQLSIQQQNQLGSLCGGSQTADNLQVLNQGAAINGHGNDSTQTASQQNFQSQLETLRTRFCK